MPPLSSGLRLKPKKRSGFNEKDSLTDTGQPSGGTSRSFSALREGLPPVTSFQPIPINTSRIEELTQQFASPGVRQLRRGLTSALATAPGVNPIIAAQQKRQAVRGFGEGLEGVVSSARSVALDIFGREFSQLTEAERGRVQEEIRRRQEALQLGVMDVNQADADRGSSSVGFTGGHTPGEIPSQSPLERLGFGSRGGATQTGAEVQRTSSGGFRPNPNIWPGGVSQQQKAIAVSQEQGIPLESFFGNQDPDFVNLKNIFESV